MVLTGAVCPLPSDATVPALSFHHPLSNNGLTIHVFHYRVLSFLPKLLTPYISSYIDIEIWFCYHTARRRGIAMRILSVRLSVCQTCGL